MTDVSAIGVDASLQGRTVPDQGPSPRSERCSLFEKCRTHGVSRLAAL